MKFLVLFACVAAASASLVTYPNGAVAPAKTPSAAGYAGYPYAAGAYGAGYPYAGAYAGYPYAGAYAHGAYPYAYNGAYGYAGHYGYAAPYAGLVAHPNGAVVPVDEPAVQAAKADHFAAKGLPVVAAPVAAPVAYAAGYAYPGLVGHPNGALVPAEPAEVVAARAEHLSHF